MGEKAARVDDDHFCPRVDPPAHKGGPILTGSPDVITGGQSQARAGDMCHCNGPPDLIRKGSDTVFVNGKQAARKNDPTDVGFIKEGCDTVFIGDSSGGGLGDAAKDGTPFLPLEEEPGGGTGTMNASDF